MKYYLLVVATAILFTSCLKESIPDAMLNSKKKSGTTATISYKMNGNAVNISVNDAQNQIGGSYTLSCRKSLGMYVFSGIESGEMTFIFYTDSLATMQYTYPASYGEHYFMRYINQSAYVKYPGDYLSFTITSYENRRISGNFSGKLTPLITAGNPNNIFGTPGLMAITNGEFENVPVLY